MNPVLGKLRTELSGIPPEPSINNFQVQSWLSGAEALLCCCASSNLLNLFLDLQIFSMQVHVI